MTLTSLTHCCCQLAAAQYKEPHTRVHMHTSVRWNPPNRTTPHHVWRGNVMITQAHFILLPPPLSLLHSLALLYLCKTFATELVSSRRNVGFLRRLSLDTVIKQLFMTIISYLRRGVLIIVYVATIYCVMFLCIGFYIRLCTNWRVVIYLTYICNRLLTL